MAYQLSDQGIFNISKVLYAQFLSQRNLKKLDLDKIDEFKRLHIKPLYPHKQKLVNGQRVIQKYGCQQYCCQFSPGRFCCCESTQPSPQYVEFGLGVCLYTKFMKHLAIFLFFVSILALVSIAVYEFAAIQSGYNITKSYYNALFSTTVGTLSSQYIKCSYSQISALSTANFNLNCGVGQVKILQPVFTNQTLSNIVNCQKQSAKQQQGLYMFSYSTISNTNSSLAQYQIQIQLNSIAYEGVNYQYVAYNYQCQNSNYKLSTVVIRSQVLLYIIVGIDLFIIVIFIFFLISEHKAQEKQIQTFKMKELAVHDFTVKIGGFRLAHLSSDLANFIIDYNVIRDSTKGANWVDGDFASNIVQIKIPQVEQIKQAQQNRNQFYQKLYQLIDQCFLQQSIDLYRYKDANDFIKKCYGTRNAPEYVEYKRVLTQYVYHFIESKRVNLIDNEVYISLLVVLTNPKDKKLMVSNARHGCFTKSIEIKQNKYSVSQPPVADMVIWQNKTKYTCLRVLIAWIITLAICLGSYLLVAFATFKKQQSLVNNKFSIDCSLFYSTSQLLSWQDSLYNSNKDIYMQCYCSTNYFSLTYADANMRTTCSKWFGDFFIYSAIPILISLGIVIYNMIIDRIFRALSRFEGHDQLSSQLYSYIIKRSFILVMNMGLIIILIKLNYSNFFRIRDLSFLFQGTYKDLTSDWYQQIGVIIILTLAFNIVIPFVDMIFVSFLKQIRKCIDRRCFCVKTSKKTKKQFIQLYANDVFPIQSRYSDFIAMILITLAFSAVMPALYVIAFLSIWFIFVCDKLLLFRVYQKPINYSQSLQSKVFKVVYIALIVHCVSSPFILSQTNLLLVGNSYKTLSRFEIILTTPYLIPYVVLFVLLVGWGLFYSTIVKCLSYCISAISDERSKIYRSKLNAYFYDSLNNYQITKLKMALQMQLHDTIQHNKKDNSNNFIKIICQNSLKNVRDLQRARLANANHQFKVRLIGKAGYDQVYDDEVFNREKKIKSIDYQFQHILQNERAIKRNSSIEPTMIQLNIQ